MSEKLARFHASSSSGDEADGAPVREGIGASGAARGKRALAAAPRHPRPRPLDPVPPLYVPPPRDLPLQPVLERTRPAPFDGSPRPSPLLRDPIATDPLRRIDPLTGRDPLGRPDPSGGVDFGAGKR